MANPAHAATALATGPIANKASAQVAFKIVIQESLHLESRDVQRRRARHTISRTTEVRADRIVVTVAQP